MRRFLVAVDGDVTPGDLAAGLASCARGVVVSEVRACVTPLRLDVARPEPVELTVRQRQLLDALVAGRSDTDLARELGLARKTLRNLRVGLYRALGVRDPARLVVQALRLGLIDAGSRTA